MSYRVDVRNGKWQVYSTKVAQYVMEDATLQDVKIALATEMEYEVKLNIVKLLMTFPQGFKTMDSETIVHQEALEAYECWYNKTHQKIVFPEQYQAAINNNVIELLT